MADQKEVIKNAKDALKKGFHAKAVKIAKDIEDGKTKEYILDKAAKLKASAQAKFKKAKANETPRVRTKALIPDDILDAYDILISKLAEIELQERQRGRANRIYPIHRFQMERWRKMFVKGTRGHK